MKNLTIAGGLTRDAVIRRTQSGDAVLSFAVGVEERNGREKRSVYFDCSLWGKRGESLAQYLTKGTRVAVSGDLSTREHEGKTYLTLRADQVTLMGGGQQRDAEPAREPQGRGPDMDDEIPFAPEWR